MPRFLYSLAFYLLVPAVLLRLLYRSIREPLYRQSPLERFGCFRSRWPGDVIWIHAVSAGETIAAAPLVRRLLADGHHCVVTNMTPTGRERARALLGDTVDNCYAPYDLPGSITRFLARNRPRLLITIDTELWPNMIHACRERGVPTMLVNGRLSEKSARGYRTLSPLTVPMLQSIDALTVQTASHADRFAALGVDTARLTVTGSIKFDSERREGFEDRLVRARTLTGGRPVFLAASTHDGEEQAALDALRAVREQVPDCLLVLAPRHTHRTSQVVGLCEAGGLPAVRFTEGSVPTPADHVLLIDTMGELDAFFPLAHVAFVGGSLVPVGGHNLLEAVQAQTAVVMGPHLRNIDDIARQFMDAGAMRVAQDAGQLADIVVELMGNAASRDAMVAAASEVMERNRGALDRVHAIAGSLLQR